MRTTIWNGISVWSCCALSAAFVLHPTTFAQGGLPSSIDAPTGSVEFGRSVASGGDVDLDDADDILIIDPQFKNATGIPVGKIYMYSGSSRELLWSLENTLVNDGERASAMHGEFIGDVNDDDRDDIIIGIPGWKNNTGALAILDGWTGGVLHVRLGKIEGDRFAYNVAGVGDYNGDETPDFAFLDRYVSNDSNTAYVCSGTEPFEIIDAVRGVSFRRITSVGQLFDPDRTTILVGSSPNDSASLPIVLKQLDDNPVELFSPNMIRDDRFGYQLAGGVDLNNDDVPDFAATGDLGERAYVYSGETLTRLSELIDASARGNVFGFTIDLADLNGDDQHEVVIGSDQRMAAFDPISGRVVHAVDADTHGFMFVYGYEFAVGDVNGDGFDDLISGRFENRNTGGVEVRIEGGGRLLLHGEVADSYPASLAYVRRGQSIGIEVSGALPFRPIHLLASRTGNGCTFLPKLGICIDLDKPIVKAATAESDEFGVARFEVNVSDNAPLGDVWLQAFDPNHYWLGAVTSNVTRTEIVD